MNLDVIHLLPDSVANQIAAGEVIQRPASVVKELVENSIDAGASNVQIIIKDAGRTLIQVIDDGCGMSVTDARMAFERHATSKIKQATDLFALRTMGFRGEALPSVAAVSEIELRTKRADDPTGTRLCISASKYVSQEPDVCATGSNMMVKRLFFNLPARRKFLKKDSVELGHIVREFERLALVNTEVGFTLVHNDVTLYQLGPASLKQRICDLFGKSLDHQLIPIATDTSLVRIDGFICLPQNARRRGALQYFFVNGRNMRHAYFHKAVLSSYEDLISSDSQPTYFIKFTVDPETIDVNIHPQKYEVKFENEQPVWQILSAAIKESLGRYNASSAIDFDVVDAPDIPVFRPDDTAAPEMDIDYHFNPFKSDNPKPASPFSDYRPHATQSVDTDWQKLYEGFAAKSAQAVAPDEMPDASLDAPQTGMPAAEGMPVVDPDGAMVVPSLSAQLDNARSEIPGMFQVKGRYIAAPSKSGLMLVDQHRAHIRVLYDKYLALVEQGQVASQRLIFPDSVSLDAAQSVVAQSIADLLGSMGFDISHLGGHDWSINAVPAMLGQNSPSQALINIIDAVAEADEDVEQSQWHRIALAMARSAAVKYGTTLSQPEIDVLLADLFKTPTPDYTPDGRLILRVIDLDDIYKMF